MIQLPPSIKPDRAAPLLALLALALALFSYAWTSRHPEYPWDGPIMLLVAGVLLLVALRRVEPSAPMRGRTPEAGDSVPWTTLPLHHVSRWRYLSFWASVGMTLVLLSHLAAFSRASYRGEFLLWLAAIAAYVLSVAPPVHRPREDWGLWWEVNRLRVLVVGGIVLVALGLRLWRLDTIPLTVGGDEGSQGLEAVRVLGGKLLNPFSTGWLGVPTMSFFFNSITIKLLGPTIFALRLPWVFVGTVTVLITFWLVTRLRGLTLGLMTAALLATYHYHIHYSRLGSNQVADPFFVSLSLLFLYRARDRNSPLDWAMVGIVMGVAQYFYAGARLTVVAVLLCVLLFFWTDRGRWKALRNLLGGSLTLAGAFLISAAPMIQYAIRFPEDYNARLNLVGIMQSGWLEREVGLRGASQAAILWDQFLRAFLAFNFYPDRTAWYGSPKPLMDGMWAVLFLLGLLYATLRVLPPRAERRYFPFVAWWWSGMILGGMLTESPPSTQRLIVLAPPAAFFVALALLRIVQFLQESLGRRGTREIAPLLVVGVVALSIMSVRWYFLEYTPMDVYGSRNGAIATAMGKFLAENLEPNETTVFLGPPDMYLGFGTIPYIEPRAAQGIDVDEPLTAPPSDSSLGLQAGQRPLFISLVERAGELGVVEQGYPGGRRFTVDDAKGQPLFWVYEP